MSVSSADDVSNVEGEHLHSLQVYYCKRCCMAMETTDPARKIGKNDHAQRRLVQPRPPDLSQAMGITAKSSHSKWMQVSGGW